MGYECLGSWRGLMVRDMEGDGKHGDGEDKLGDGKGKGQGEREDAKSMTQGP